ncbi:MAG TPA: cysteine peptidase family C39 domain-containing protein, partial [Mucilaginibacter sp.]|nr:cysteine peptidase family C39 domain-containing protein [Mucilaginibacter sp.]
MSPFNKQENAEAVVIGLLKSLKLNIDREEIITELGKHPDYPSLLAISDVLANFDINNAAYSIEIESLPNAQCPFIAHTQQNNEFVLVSRITEDHIFLSNDRYRNYKLSIEDFKKIFTGIVLTIEGTTATKNKAWNDVLAPLGNPISISGLLLAFIGTIIFNTEYQLHISLSLLTLTLLKSTGLIVSILLLVQSIDSNNALVQKLCSINGNKGGCNNVLSSDAAIVFKGLTWSEVGFFYFAGTWLTLLLGGGTLTAIKLILALNLISLPYTFYSIYYQSRVVKQWCVLCCCVQAVLWLEFITMIFMPGIITAPLKYDIGAVVTLFTCLLLPVFLWLILKPVFIKSQQVMALTQQVRQFKYNTDLFKHILTNQPKFVLPDEDWSIILGNSEADNIITLVTNPYCGPCASTHSLLDEWLEKRDDLQVRVVFAVSNIDG